MSFGCGVSSRQLSFVKVVRNEPLKSLPPDFVTAFTSPPENRPNSAETAPLVTVVSWTASSMKSGTACPRRFSLSTTPFTRKRFSKDMAPAMVMACVDESWLLVLGPVLETPGASSTVAFSVRSDGSAAMSAAL